ncbi:MAG: crosslink repair DNA glycosylase YcaQ family protein [Mycobacterium sp.]|uniref:winged helix-turn-helix domain-containing protein n=1 Tax=Mycobacterium sp. TaxID=1785 RepID=UPI003C4CF425
MSVPSGILGAVSTSSPKLTAAQARRIAVAAQGFSELRPTGAVTRAHLRRLISRIQVLQLDSVSVAVRAHYAPVFSRLGPYDRGVLDRAAWEHSARSPRLLVEYWAHEAALMAVDDWPLLRWRMRQYQHGRWGTHIVKANPKLADKIVTAIAELGPSTAGQIEAYLAAGTRGPRGDWWGGRTDTKWVAEALFSSGVLTTATRVGFARHYDLTERVLPPEVLAREVDEQDAIRELTLRAAGALGVGTEADIRDYFRLAAGQAKPAVAKLVADGELEQVEVAGWSAPAYLVAGQTIPRRDRGTALLCPFDPLIFFRPRVQRLFEFHYRIEIYTPAAQRQYGYYVWPFLLDGELVGRVDLKADRTADALHVVAAFIEPDRSPSQVAAALADELAAMASWLGLAGVTVGKRGDLAGELRKKLQSR